VSKSSQSPIDLRTRRLSLIVLVLTSLVSSGSDSQVRPELRKSAAPNASASPGATVTMPPSERWRLRFAECDARDTCDGEPVRRGCLQDPNHNSVLLKLADGTVFFDAKMGLDVDGSRLSALNPGQTDQPDTSLRYPLPGSPSIDSGRVTYIVIPQPGFDDDLQIEVGDVAAVVYHGKRVYAIVGDTGPTCKIGEGSMRLHEMLGHTVCKRRTSGGDCLQVRDVSIERNVLYFIFPHTRGKLWEGLTPANINDRVEAIGRTSWDALIRSAKGPEP
jgi:Fungal chitosanase of glycosyl hydrolase group 75